MPSSKVVPFRKDFQWACRPILSWVSFIGIPLDVDESPSKKMKILAGIYALLIYVGQSVNSGMRLAEYTEDLQSANRSAHSVTSSLNADITFFNYFLSGFLAHTGLLLGTKMNWSSLVAILRQVEQENWLKSVDFQSFRYVSWAALTVVLLEIAFYLGLGFSKFLLMEPLHMVKSLLIGLVSSYPQSGPFLFCCLGRIAGLMLKNLRRRIESEKIVSSSTISDWKYVYALIGRLVDRLNDCFGFILLAVITSLFIRIINNTFLSLLDFGAKGIDTGAITFVVKDLVYLILFAFVASRIRHEAVEVSKSLRRIPPLSNTSQQVQLDFLILEVSLSLPKVTAMGFFEVHLGLFPTLVGTTLTYLIILCQFQSSE